MNENITKEGIEVEAGQVWRDLDKRLDGRCCKVRRVSFGRATMVRCTQFGRELGDRETVVAVRRMHTGSTGWELVTPYQRPDGIRVGDEVVLIRGSRGRGPESGPGFERRLRARYLGGDGPHMVTCALLEDDPNATCAPFHAGEIGTWHGELFIQPA
jgi:hypothetical protein